MKMPSFKRLYTSDFAQDDRALIDKLSFYFNNGIESLYNALNSNLNITDNLAAVTRDFEVSVLASGVPTITTSFGVDGTRRVLGLEILKLTNNTNAAGFPSGSPFITWEQNTAVVLIKHITGLSVGNSYTIRVVAWYEN